MPLGYATPYHPTEVSNSPRPIQFPRYDGTPYRSPSADALPEDVLLEIFDAYRLELDTYGWTHHRGWYKLIHICRRWRQIILASSIRLNLQLVCTYGTPVKEMLTHSPPLPIVMNYIYNTLSPLDEVGALFSLQYSSRIREIRLVRIPDSSLQKLVEAMDKPFPTLETLVIETLSDTGRLVLPPLFLGGHAPKIRCLTLDGFDIPGQLLSSTRGLSTLWLERVPSDANLNPETLLSRLHGMPHLEEFSVSFCTAKYAPTAGNELPRTYLERLLAGIEVPSVKQLSVTLSKENLFVIPHLSRLMEYARGLECPVSRVSFSESTVSIDIRSRGQFICSTPYSVQVSCRWLDQQVSVMEQICTQLATTLCIVEELDLTFYLDELPRGWVGEISPGRWRSLLQPFRGAKTVRAEGAVVWEVARALKPDADVLLKGLLPEMRELDLRFRERDHRETAALAAFGDFVTLRRAAGRLIRVRCNS
ncbi:hypothetical protein BC834DRAFT_967198 [Gloeopeniophorella convolvens]|nr:hypothetical protein BC834DRAFT_967198 [Gloeopeniophorella convolvens]